MRNIRPSIILITIAALFTTMLLNRIISQLVHIEMGRQLIEAAPLILRIVFLIIYWVFWLTRFLYAKHTTSYLVYLVLISDVLLYFIGLDVIRQDQSQPTQVQPWLITFLQIGGMAVGVGTLIFIKKLHITGWIVASSLFSACFILGGFIPMLLDRNTFRSLIWLVLVELVLVAYLSFIFRKPKAL